MNDKTDDFGIRFHGGVVNELCAKLCYFLQFALQIGGIGIGIPPVTEAQRKLFVAKVFCCAACNGRGKVRSKNQSISFLVKEFVEFPAGGSADFAGKDIKKLKGRRLNILIAIQPDTLLQSLFYLKLCGIFFSVNVPDTFRCVQKLFTHNIHASQTL